MHKNTIERALRAFKGHYTAGKRTKENTGRFVVTAALSYSIDNAAALETSRE